MGYFKDLEIEIIELFEEGATEAQIAAGLQIDRDIVKSLINNYINGNYDDSMDGDFDSAMTSAGFGTDEDYGYYGDE